MEWLANISIWWILLAVGILSAALLVLRLLRRGDPGIAALEENIRTVIAVLVVVFLVIRPFLFQSYFIPSGSMEPTLLGPDAAPGGSGTGDRLLADKLLYLVSEPKRYDIAVFKAP